MTTTLSVTDTAFPDLKPLPRPRMRWPQWLAQAASLALLGIVLYELRDLDTHQLRSTFPHDPAFWLTLTVLYLALPIADWIIFRRLWRLPLSGFGVVLGKRISNELLMNYSGEVYFYLWARQRAHLTHAPFGAIKDVNILSALAGNALALVLMAVAYPWFSSLDLGQYSGAIKASTAVVLALSMLPLLFRRRIFTLSHPELIWVFFVHIIRLLAGVGLCALLWHIAMPDVAIGFWFALSLLRLLVGRLPLLPNRELLFAAIAVFLIGNESAMAGLVALTSTSLLALHLIIGGMLGLGAFLNGLRPTLLIAGERP